MEKTLNLNGQSYAVRRIGTSSQKASVRINRTRITIRVPVSWQREEAFKTFLELEKKAVQEIEKQPEKFKAVQPVEFFNGQEITVLGKPFKILAIPGNTKCSRARLIGDAVEVTVAGGIDDETKKQHVSNLARRVISHALLPIVETRVRELNDKYFQFSLNAVFIKEQSSKWGSCSVNRNVNLNFKLFFAPEEVFDYVIIHELSHLKEQNHSEAFWNLVASAVPNYQEARKWLRENGSKLGVGGEG